MLLGMRSALLGSVPALYLPFALTGTLDPRITFSRPSLATMYDSTGKLTYAPNNLVTFSQDFTNAAWVLNEATLSASTDPNGGSTAQKLIPSVNNSGTHRLQRTSPNGPNGNTFWSIYAKADGYSWIKLRYGSYYGNFDVTNGVVGNTNATSTSIVSIGNGWYRVGIKAPATSTDIAWYYVANSDNAGLDTASFSGNGTSGIIIAFSQNEAVTYQTTPSTYNATTSAAYYGPRFDYNPATLVARGLLIEEARTNLVTYSDQFDNAAWTKTATTVTANATTSPDGTTNADKLVETVTTNIHNASQTATVSSGATVTESIFLKASERAFATVFISDTVAKNYAVLFNLSTGVVVGNNTGFFSYAAPVSSSILNIGNGWYICTVTATLDAGRTSASGGAAIMPDGSTVTTSPSYAGVAGSGIFVYGAQLEAGSFATSYIPTAASAVARSADSATMTGTNFSSWYNQTQGTFVVNSSTFRAAGSSYGSIIEPNDGTASNRIALGNLGVSGYQEVQASGAQQALWNEGTANNSNAYASNASVKLALAYATNDANRALDGTLGTTDVTFTSPVVNRMDIGSDFAARRLNGHIASLAYYNTRLPNATLQSLTLPVIADYYFLVTAGGDQLTDASDNPLYTQPLYL